MNNKQEYLLKSSFAFLIFVLIGYTVQFYPETLNSFDTTIQSFVRGQLPDGLTQFFRLITVSGNVLSQVIIVAVATIIFFLLKWKSEAYFILASGSLAGIIIMVMKLIYHRHRPTLEHLVFAPGFSFPSGHALGSIMIFGALALILMGRVHSRGAKLAIQILIAMFIILVGLSRIYLGVHFPSDVIGGFVLGYGVLNLLYYYYNQKRFEWRFQSIQK